MTSGRTYAAISLLVVLAACAADAQQASDRLVVSSDRELAELASALLPDLAERSGLEIRQPVRLEKRSRDHLVAYLETKLDEELPVERARSMVDAYSLLGLVPADLDLRGVLMGLYTEQIAGFYEPDSTALFVLEDQPQALLQGILVHELVHAIQDQNADLDALTDRELGNDRAVAAQAVIEGHATLVMLEFMTEQMTGVPVDLGRLPDFSAQMRPALQGMRAQFPALASAPRVIQESLLFPYLEGAGFVQALWTGGARVSPFGDNLASSTEQILARATDDPPVEFDIEVEGGRVAYADVLGSLEVGVLLDEHAGAGAAELSAAWDGDRYVLVEGGDGRRGLIWIALWEDALSRDRVAGVLESALPGSGRAGTVERLDVMGRPAIVLRVGPLDGVTARARATGSP